MKSTAALTLCLALLLAACGGTATAPTAPAPGAAADATPAAMAPAATVAVEPTSAPAPVTAAAAEPTSAPTTAAPAEAAAQPTLGKPVPSPSLDSFKLMQRPFPEGPTAYTGQSYPYRLYTHCGIDFIAFSGRWWRAAKALSDGKGNPPAGWDNPFQEGTMLVEAPDKVVFTGANGETVTFGLTDDDPPPCQ